jgi:hypothetical protein
MEMSGQLSYSCVLDPQKETPNTITCDDDDDDDDVSELG